MSFDCYKYGEKSNIGSFGIVGQVLCPKITDLMALCVCPCYVCGISDALTRTIGLDVVSTGRSLCNIKLLRYHLMFNVVYHLEGRKFSKNNFRTIFFTMGQINLNNGNETVISFDQSLSENFGFCILSLK